MSAEPWVFLAHGFHRENLRLQPWRYLYELATRFSSERRVVVITDGPLDVDRERWPEGIEVVRTNRLTPMRQGALGALLREERPARVWWSMTPRSVAYAPLLGKVPGEIVALVTCPMYSWRLLLRVWRQGVPYNELAALLQQRAIPRRLFGRLLVSPRVSRVVTLSQATRLALVAAGVPPVKVTAVPAGLDPADLVAPDDRTVRAARASYGFPEGSFVFVYLGALRRIRGFDALLAEFGAVAKAAPRARLAVLARGADEAACAAVVRRCAEQGFGDRVAIRGGWLSPEQVRAHLVASDAVVLPFLAAPSDMPIAVLEALACGKPVVASPIDGMSELVGDRGLLADPTTRGDLGRALVRLSSAPGLVERLSAQAAEFGRSHPGWDRVAALAAGA